MRGRRRGEFERRTCGSSDWIWRGVSGDGGSLVGTRDLGVNPPVFYTTPCLNFSQGVLIESFDPFMDMARIVCCSVF